MVRLRSGATKMTNEKDSGQSNPHGSSGLIEATDVNALTSEEVSECLKIALRADLKICKEEKQRASAARTALDEIKAVQKAVNDCFINCASGCFLGLKEGTWKVVDFQKNKIVYRKDNLLYTSSHKKDEVKRKMEEKSYTIFEINNSPTSIDSLLASYVKIRSKYML